MRACRHIHSGLGQRKEPSSAAGLCSRPASAAIQAAAAALAGSPYRAGPGLPGMLMPTCLTPYTCNELHRQAHSRPAMDTSSAMPSLSFQHMQSSHFQECCMVCQAHSPVRELCTP